MATPIAKYNTARTTNERECNGSSLTSPEALTMNELLLIPVHVYNNTEQSYRTLYGNFDFYPYLCKQ